MGEADASVLEPSSLQGLQAAKRYLPFAMVQQTRLFVWQTASWLTAGTVILIWLCDAVKAKGLSDGYGLVFGLNLAAGQDQCHLCRSADFQHCARCTGFWS